MQDAVVRSSGSGSSVPIPPFPPVPPPRPPVPQRPAISISGSNSCNSACQLQDGGSFVAFNWLRVAMVYDFNAPPGAEPFKIYLGSSVPFQVFGFTQNNPSCPPGADCRTQFFQTSNPCAPGVRCPDWCVRFSRQFRDPFQGCLTMKASDPPLFAAPLRGGLSPVVYSSGSGSSGFNTVVLSSPGQPFCSNVNRLPVCGLYYSPSFTGSANDFGSQSNLVYQPATIFPGDPEGFGEVFGNVIVWQQ